MTPIGSASGIGRLTLSTLLLLAGGGAVHAATAAPWQVTPRTSAGATASSAAPDTILQHLPASREELTFRGEWASRNFTVPLARSEAARIATLQVALHNTVSLLPERSALKIAVNGRPLATLPANAADKPTNLSIAVPPGLLVPGPNTVQVTATLSHRVDCSVAATYELWAALDPAGTGFVVPRDALPVPVRPEDLAVLPLAEDGTTHVHVRLADTADPGAIAEAARAVQHVVARTGIVRPVVDVGPGPGTGAGFDLVTVRGAPAGAGMSLARDEAGQRTVVSVDPDTADGETAAGASHLPESGAVTGAFRASFAAMGHATDVFTGRHYLSDFNVTLPPDFMATNDRAKLLLDGGHGAALVGGDTIVVRVNGALVTSAPLAAGRAERFAHREFEMPLKFFHPGRNDITLEAVTSAAADAQCATVTMPRDARLTISDTSELVFPDFAHLTEIPQIPAALAARDTLPVYLPSGNPALAGAALTVLANMATEGGSKPALQWRDGAPADDDTPGLVVAAADALPAAISADLHRLSSPQAAPDAAAPEGSAAGPSDDAAATPASLERVLGPVRSFLRAQGFFYGTDATRSLALAPESLLVAAVAPDVAARDGSRRTLPRFAPSSEHWLVVTAANPAALGAGVATFVANGHWRDLRGEATAYDPATDAVQVRHAQDVTYVVPKRLILADVRPILGGLMTDNIPLSLAVMALLLGLLGVSTHALLRRTGVR